MKKVLALVLALMLFVPAFAFAEDVVKVGVFEPVTGENGGGGFQEVLGMRYANQVAPTVDIGGKPYKVELVEVDNKSDKTEAVTAAQSLIASGVSVVLGSYGSGVSIAAGGIFADAKVAAIGASCTNPQVTLGNDYYFRVCYIDPFQGTVMANYAFQNGAKTAAVITQLGDDYSSGFGNFFLKAFQALAGDASIVSNEQYQTNQTDFKAILTNIKAANPDVIFAPTSITVAPLLIKQARELGITAKIMAGDTWDNVTIIENAGAAAEGVTLSTFYFDETDATKADFVNGFKAYLKANPESMEKNGGESIAAVTALGYDAYMTAIAAIQAAGTTDSQAIRDALPGISIEGLTGAISFDENRDAIKDTAYIKTVENGAFKLLEPVTIKN